MKYSTGLHIPLFIFLLAFIPGSFAESLVLVEDGKAQASIVIGSEASDQANEAAQTETESGETGDWRWNFGAYVFRAEDGRSETPDDKEGPK
ncbi:MAG TPA: hypothetical protein PLZ55_08625 [bacterium]|nr:hypothetical protein [bacterium]